MKKTISILLALLIMSTQLLVSANTEYIPKGLNATQEQYAELISTAIEKSEYEEEQIDKEHIFIVEHTSPIPMRKNEEAIWLYVALPIVGSSDISYAHFDKGKYVMAVTNFTALKGIENPYGDKLQQYIDKNTLSEPTEITNVWVGERVHVFAYKVICDNKEYIIPYYFTQDTLFNLTENEDCNIEIGKAYTMEEFLTICEKEVELFTEYRKAEREQEKIDNSYTYVDNNGEEVTIKPEKVNETIETDETKEDQQEKSGDGDTKNTYTFEELTGLSMEAIDHIVIRSGVDGVGYSTAYDKVISDIYNTINSKSFNVYVSDGDGWSYEISFVDKNHSAHSYTISTGIVVKEKDGLTYRTSNEEELKKVVENVYGLIANDCSNWSADYIVQAKDLGFLEDISDIEYKDPITREKFCEIVYNMLMKTMDKTWSVPTAIPFEDTYNSKVATLYYEEIIRGKGDKFFEPNDYLTREESATILYRLAEYMEIDMPQSAYNESAEYYADKHLISDWAFNAVYYMKEMGVMVGTSNTEFSPKDTYTAEQAIATIIRLIECK